MPATPFKWSYPYNAADTATCFFQASPASPICQWRPPGQTVPVPRQGYARAVDGTKRCYQRGTAGTAHVLEFRSLPAGSASSDTALWGYLGVERFLTIVGFGLYPFGLWDEEGATEIEVRYMGGFEAWRKNLGGLWSGQIRVEEEV